MKTQLQLDLIPANTDRYDVIMQHLAKVTEYSYVAHGWMMLAAFLEDAPMSLESLIGAAIIHDYYDGPAEAALTVVQTGKGSIFTRHSIVTLFDYLFHPTSGMNLKRVFARVPSINRAWIDQIENLLGFHLSTVNKDRWTVDPAQPIDEWVMVLDRRDWERQRKNYVGKIANYKRRVAYLEAKIIDLLGPNAEQVIGPKPYRIHMQMKEQQHGRQTLNSRSS